MRRSRTAALIAPLLVGLVACSGPPKEVEEPEEEKLDAKALLAEGIALDTEGKHDDAEKAYRQSIRLEPAEYEANQRLVALMIKRGRADDALAAAKAYAAANSEDLRGLHLIADAQLASGDYQGAADAMTTLLELDDDATAYEKRARARILGKDLIGGENDYRKALELDGENIEYQVGLGSVLIRRGSPAQARELLSKALATNEEHPRANVLIGITYRSEMELDKALKHHLRAVRVAPDSARGHFELGITHNLRGDNIAAVASLAKAVELEPNDGINWYAYGEALRLQGKVQESLEPYKRAVELMPDHAKAPNKLGYVLFKLGKVSEAEVVLTKAVRNNPDDPYPYFNLGMVYETGEKLTLAVNSFQRFLDLAPEGDKDIGLAKKKIRELKRKIRRR